MKHINNQELMNSSNQPETIQEPKHLFREVEKRYNIIVGNMVLIGLHHETIKSGFVEYLVKESFLDKDDLETLNIGKLPLTTYNDIYKLTNSGYYSYNNPFNTIISDEYNQLVFMPILTISRGFKKISFWMNDPFYRDLFYDTELIMKVDEHSPDKTTTEIEELLMKKYEKQLLMLNKYFNK